jgi:polyhydroxyalkanoate synthesis regulator protein
VFALTQWQTLVSLVRRRNQLYCHQMKKLIKRYARTRLYDTQEARYVTISDLREWIAKGLEFVVIDADTGDDITKVLLA